ncbi:hypothetical protein M7I_5033 [Glarea lozoyensis 74030]|uniref:Uncharacterized protein n=1 Tax=Glarea lozoyensis (strain ATCC 74030 / MF5533) TaxID=1104152 RepID=H0EQS8_GLAL7|nr:hypothetical protein M7I_5033 [Glarea lozoyensis 74030]
MWELPFGVSNTKTNPSALVKGILSLSLPETIESDLEPAIDSPDHPSPSNIPSQHHRPPLKMSTPAKPHPSPTPQRHPPPSSSPPSSPSPPPSAPPT